MDSPQTHRFWRQLPSHNAVHACKLFFADAMRDEHTSAGQKQVCAMAARPSALSVLETVAAGEADGKEDDESQDKNDEDDNEPHLLVLPPHLAPQCHTCTP